MNHHGHGHWKLVGAIVLFGISFGYVEASIVVYLRELYEPLVLKVDPQRQPGELFPLITFDQMEQSGPKYFTLLKIEVVRELATLLMIGAVGWWAGRDFNTRFAAFLVAFGVWDIFYYVFLKLLIDWPSRLMEWDLLFLVPVPWAAPVLAPVLVAVSMVGSGTIVIQRRWAGRPLQIRWWQWLLVVSGGIIIVVAFCWDYPVLMAGGMPVRFRWDLLLAGVAIGLSGFLAALFRRSTTSF